MSQTFYRSESIYNTIGDYPVLDQFDVSYSNQMVGTVYDRYITGSLLQYSKNIFTGNQSLVSGKRGFAFSKLGVSREEFPNTGIPTTTLPLSYESQPWRERAGVIRNVKLFSDSERYYDSLAPSIPDYIKAFGGNIGFFTIAGITYGVIGIGSYIQSDFIANSLIETFPFESKVSSIKRSKKIQKSYNGIYDVATLTLSTKFVPLNKIHIIEFDNDTFTSANWWIDGYTAPTRRGLSEFDISKLIFGFGDKNTKVNNTTPPPSTIGSKGLLKERRKAGLYAVGPIARGWKYGLISGMPYYTSCIFRRDRYGQLRDMLEQRLNTSFISDYENSFFNYSGNNVESPVLPQSQNPTENATVNGILAPSFNISSTNINTITNDPPVRINFTRQTYIESSGELVYFSEKPENTWSSNLSTYATSSLPYFDGEAKNRGPITTPPNLSIISTLSDVFGNITVGP